MSLLNFIIRIMVCFGLSLLVGIERQYRHKMVGLRTVILVSLGAFMFNWVSYSCDIADRTRIAAQIVSGIGFLGAGVIIRDGSNKIKGLNTAATLWCVAAIGVLTSSGLLIESSICTLLVLIDNVVLRLLSLKIMDKINKKQEELCTIRIACKKDSESVVRTSFSKYIEKQKLDLLSLEKNEITEDEVKLNACLLTLTPSLVEDLVKVLSVLPGINSISWVHEKYYKADQDNSDEE